MAKGGLGGGLAMLAVPLMALVIPPLQAAAILLPLLIVMDAFAVWTFRGKWDYRQLKIMIPGALVGVCIGALTYRYISSDGIKIMIAILSLAFGLEYYLKRYRARHNQHSSTAPATSSVTKGSLWSALSGYTSFAIHAGGPPASVYILPLRLDKTTLMATLALFFAVINWEPQKETSLRSFVPFDITKQRVAKIQLLAIKRAVRLYMFLVRPNLFRNTLQRQRQWRASISPQRLHALDVFWPACGEPRTKTR